MEESHWDDPDLGSFVIIRKSPPISPPLSSEPHELLQIGRTQRVLIIPDYTSAPTNAEEDINLPSRVGDSHSSSPAETSENIDDLQSPTSLPQTASIEELPGLDELTVQILLSQTTVHTVGQFALLTQRYGEVYSFLQEAGLVENLDEVIQAARDLTGIVYSSKSIPPRLTAGFEISVFS